MGAPKVEELAERVALVTRRARAAPEQIDMFAPRPARSGDAVRVQHELDAARVEARRKALGGSAEPATGNRTTQPPGDFADALHYAPPVGDLTGGALNASEAERAFTGRPFAIVGFLFHLRLKAMCRRCFDTETKKAMSLPPSMKGEGYMVPLYMYSKNEKAIGRRCVTCGEAFLSARSSEDDRAASEPACTAAIGGTTG